MSRNRTTRTDRLAIEAQRYLDVVERFAALGADPHAKARARAAQARADKQVSPCSGAQEGRRRLLR